MEGVLVWHGVWHAYVNERPKAPPLLPLRPRIPPWHSPEDFYRTESEAAHSTQQQLQLEVQLEEVI
jgi:hypothetical protein